MIQVLEPLLYPSRRERLQRVIAQRLDSVAILLDAPHDPHNGAAILRTAEAFGVGEIHVVPRTEEFLVSRVVAKGARRWVDVVTHREPHAAVEALNAAQYELVATHPQGELTPADLRSIARVCLVFGNEHDGISKELHAAASRTVRIPMRGLVESLNLSVSAAILLAEATGDRPGDLPPTRRAELYARWLCRAVKRADRVLAAYGDPPAPRAESPASPGLGFPPPVVAAPMPQSLPAKAVLSEQSPSE